MVDIDPIDVMLVREEFNVNRVLALALERDKEYNYETHLESCVNKAAENLDGCHLVISGMGNKKRTEYLGFIEHVLEKGYPLIIATGGGDFSEEMERKGAAGFLALPCSPAELRATVSDAVKRYYSQDLYSKALY